MTFVDRTRACFWALLLLAAPAAAHDFWIEPSLFDAAPNQPIQVHLRVGENFIGEPVPRLAQRIERFVLIGEGDERSIVGVEGRDPAGITRVEQPGPHVIGYRSRPMFVELEAAKFENYLREEGLETIIARRAAAGDAAKPGRERYSRCAKALINGWPGTERVIGQRLEIVPLSDPTAVSARTGAFRVLFDSRPLPGMQLVAFRKGDPQQRSSARTDGDGRAELPLGAADAWIVKGVHMFPAAPAADGADWESVWTSITFERK